MAKVLEQNSQYIQRTGAHILFKGMLEVLAGTSKNQSINILDALIAYLWNGDRSKNSVDIAVEQANAWYGQHMRHTLATPAAQPFSPNSTPTTPAAPDPHPRIAMLVRAGSSTAPPGTYSNLPGLQLLQAAGAPPTSLKWLKPLITSADFVPDARAGHATCSQTTKFWTFGGNLNGVFSNQLMVFDTDALGWKEKTVGGVVPSVRAGHSLNVWNNSLWLFGGADLKRDYFPELFTCNLDQLEWEQVMPTNTQNGTSQQQLPWPLARAGHTATLIQHNKSSSPQQQQPPPTNNTRFTDAFLYLFGGEDADRCLSDLWVLNLRSLEWKQIKPKGTELWPPARSQHTCIAYDNNLWVFGGDNHNDYLSDLWMFNTVCPI
eukprot:TRINITY_DN34600_c0_g1_i1.p1 TRINITY_DN34600_c0_g1~~TRINITY_DN34600_c0_g1_i1.p1  ORF type:complete len:376 (+),score=27.08 TRINITY_DN34600_c0_g1_i1:14-1141(+)